MTLACCLKPLRILPIVLALGTVPASADDSMLGPQGLSDSEVEAIKTTIDAWTTALTKGEIDEWNSYWAPGSVLLAPNEQAVTDNTKRDVLARAPQYADMESFSFSDWDVVGRDDLAVVHNNITVTGTAPPPVMKQIIVLRKQANGDWLIQAAIYNAE